ncbi:bifunctional riboflavin kinase/FAD synthetase [Desulfogranum japonicum]|uniref:bifunctional riboflavin kinase/FAD synthetase n=1 Tax=Desulfogranum japonicum TaxID=231447 RepID=UPI00040932DB|nr:bifunctional riboflavin kinase/FAD synthetase [Desulfogranum japonicum]
MKIYRNLDEITAPFANAQVTIGNFDGVHLGHKVLFEKVVEQAHQEQGTSVAVTFDPHPLKVLSPNGIRLISTTAQKVEQIKRAGIEALVIIPFTREVASTPAEVFVDTILRQKIGLKGLVIGYDYALGKGRQGDIAFLRKLGEEKGFSVEVIEPHYVDNDLVSSTRIRELVTAGRMRDVYKLLGRFYQIRGIVQPGQRRGRKLGFPTANLCLSEEDLCPKSGVYVTQVLYDGKQYGGVANIGYNPTFGVNELVAETHIFDFNADVYGKPLKINLLRYLRTEMAFESAEALVHQISKDVAVAHKVLAQAREKKLIAYQV